MVYYINFDYSLDDFDIYLSEGGTTNFKLIILLQQVELNCIWKMYL